MGHRSTHSVRRLTLALAAAWPLTATAGVFSEYAINGGKLSEGARAEEIRRVAGEPVEVQPVFHDSRQIGEDWVYLCSRKGTGPCETVREDGKRRMILHLRYGRLKSVYYEGVAGS